MYGSTMAVTKVREAILALPPDGGEGGDGIISQTQASALSLEAARVSPAIKSLYGIGAVAFGVENLALGTLLMLFFNQVVGLPAPWVGAAIMIALIFDGIFDPLIGQWSDRLNSRWGRRHPFMYASALPLAIAFYCLFDPPYGWSNEVMFGYLLFCPAAVRATAQSL